jgi:hypothetical protein
MEVLAGLISFAALVLIWVVAPSRPAHETEVETVAAPAPREALA